MRNKPAKRDFRAEIESLMPSEEWAQVAWYGCLQWAITSNEVMARYRAETGDNWTPGKTPIERMVDDATGRMGGFLVDFIRWMNANIWGEVDGRAGNGDEPEVKADAN